MYIKIQVYVLNEVIQRKQKPVFYLKLGYITKRGIVKVLFSHKANPQEFGVKISLETTQIGRNLSEVFPNENPKTKEEK